MARYGFEKIQHSPWTRISEHDILDGNSSTYYFLLALFPLLLFSDDFAWLFPPRRVPISRNKLLTYLATVMLIRPSRWVHPRYEISQPVGGGKCLWGLLAALVRAASNGNGAISAL